MKSRRMFIGPIYEEIELPILKENNQTDKKTTCNKRRIVKETILLQDRSKTKYLELQKSKNILLRVALEIPFLQNKNFISETTEPKYICKNELRKYISKKTNVSLANARKNLK